MRFDQMINRIIINAENRRRKHLVSVLPVDGSLRLPEGTQLVEKGIPANQSAEALVEALSQVADTPTDEAGGPDPDPTH